MHILTFTFILIISINSYALDKLIILHDPNNNNSVRTITDNPSIQYIDWTKPSSAKTEYLDLCSSIPHRFPALVDTDYDILINDARDINAATTIINDMVLKKQRIIKKITNIADKCIRALLDNDSAAINKCKVDLK